MSPHRQRVLYAVLLCCAVAVTACATRPAQAPVASAQAVTIMTFNVENLFDTADDPGKDDSTYLPLSAKQSATHREHCNRLPVERWRDQCLNYDWNEDALEAKFAALTRAILQVDNGRGPDIVVLQEVENLSVLERLRTGYLGTAAYHPAVLVEGADARGIDVGFLSRFELAGEPVLHPVTHPGAEESRTKDTRGILEATFVLPDGSLLTGYAVHFPAPFHPRDMREQAYAALNALRDDLPAGRAAFAAGDFNTTSEEDAAYGLLDRLARPGWRIAHETGCAGCPGTYYYPPAESWSFLDMILWARPRPGESVAWRLRPGSTRLVNSATGQTSAAGTPERFELPAGTGISDHWPLQITIEKPR